MSISFSQTLEAPLVKLIPIQADDFERLYAVAADPELWVLHPEPLRYQREVFGRYFEGAVASGSAYLIFDQQTGALIGSSRYYQHQAAERSIAIGYTFLARSHWGGAYNSALKALMLGFIFQYVDTVYFHVGEFNFRSQKAVKKLGAEDLGIHEVLIGDQTSRECLFRLSAESWATRQA